MPLLIKAVETVRDVDHYLDASRIPIFPQIAPLLEHQAQSLRPSFVRQS